MTSLGGHELVKRWGPERVEAACARALEAEAVDVNLISRMIERAREDAEPEQRPEGDLVAARFGPGPIRVPGPQGGRSMSDPTPTVSPELRALMRRLRLGQLLATLPERLALARTHDLTHLEFLAQLFSDEVTRRHTASAGVRARAAHLDPTMVLEAWDDTAEVRFDRGIWSELVPLRFVERANNALHQELCVGARDRGWVLPPAGEADTRRTHPTPASPPPQLTAQRPPRDHHGRPAAMVPTWSHAPGNGVVPSGWRAALSGRRSNGLTETGVAPIWLVARARLAAAVTDEGSRAVLPLAVGEVGEEVLHLGRRGSRCVADLLRLSHD